MNKALINIFLINLLIVIELCPAIMLLNVLMSIKISMEIWFCLGIVSLIAISYIMYLNNKRD